MPVKKRLQAARPEQSSCHSGTGNSVGRRQDGTRLSLLPQHSQLFWYGYDALHERRDIVDEIVHMTVVISNDPVGKILQYHRIRQVAYTAAARKKLNGADNSPCFLKFLRDGPADASCAAGDYGNFICKHSLSPSLSVFVQSLHQKTHRTETVVAGEHGGLGISHPAVIKVLAPVAQNQHKG